MNFLDYTLDSFARVFKLDINPELSVDENVRKIIHQTAYVVSALTWLQPIPLLDFMFLAPLHAKMTAHIAKAKGFDLSEARALDLSKELIGTIGLSYLAQQVVAGVGKFVPVLFGIYLFPLFYAATWALGRMIEYYFNCQLEGRTPTTRELRRVYQQALVTGKTLGAKLKLEDVKAKAQELLGRVRRAEGSEDAPPREPEAAPKASSPPIKVRERSELASKIRVTKSEPTVKVEPRPAKGAGDAPKKPSIAAEELSPIDALERLSRRRQDKEIGEDEYRAERARILEKM